MRTQRSDSEHQRSASDAIPFPAHLNPTDAGPDGDQRFDLTGLPGAADHVIEAIENMSRRIDDLARELNCLGYFDDDDGPKAA